MQVWTHGTISLKRNETTTDQISKMDSESLKTLETMLNPIRLALGLEDQHYVREKMAIAKCSSSGSCHVRPSHSSHNYFV